MQDFITEEAKEVLLSGNRDGKLIFEHMFPKNIYLTELLQQTKMVISLPKSYLIYLINIFMFVPLQRKRKIKSYQVPRWE